MNSIAAFFRANGTKLLGYIVSTIAALAFMDAALVTELLGERGYKWVLLIAGVITIIRGHTNTAAIKDDIRVEEKAKEAVKVEQKALEIRADNIPTIAPQTSATRSPNTRDQI